MDRMNAVTICVEFDDLLRVTLPRYLPLFDNILVVTTEEDARTQEYVAWMQKQHHNLTCFRTNAFELGGSPFNKGAALEAAMDVIGRTGWIAVFDADMMLPASVEFPELQRGCLYGTRRRLLLDPREWSKWEFHASWQVLPLAVAHHPWKEGFCTLGGHFLLFHAHDPVLRQLPWFSREQRFAGGADSDFVARWPVKQQHRLPFEMLHLGTPETNWAGRVDDRLDDIPIRLKLARKAQMDKLHQERAVRGDYSWEETK